MAKSITRRTSQHSTRRMDNPETGATVMEICISVGAIGRVVRRTPPLFLRANSIHFLFSERGSLPRLVHFIFKVLGQKSVQIESV